MPYPSDPGSDLRIRLDGVSLCYRLAKQRIPSIKDYTIHLLKGALSYEKLWALSDVSFSVRDGETVGIIGRNGAGKSTLLKVISGVLKPTTGKRDVRGVVVPILELGTGFDHELSGVENIYLNALLLGRKRKEIDAALDRIIEFSGLGDFVRAPIRNYSSGMVARLGFSIATAWLPNLLILDEVLAVGDAAFTRRCEERIAEFHQAGTTILLVSHSEAAIKKSCTRCLWLDAGRLRADGPTEQVLAAYSSDSNGTEPAGREGGQLHPEELPRG